MRLAATRNTLSIARGRTTTTITTASAASSSTTSTLSLLRPPTWGTTTAAPPGRPFFLSSPFLRLYCTTTTSRNNSLQLSSIRKLHNSCGVWYGGEGRSSGPSTTGGGGERDDASRREEERKEKETARRPAVKEDQRQLESETGKPFSEISNKATVLSEIDHALGRSQPPALEYLYVQPAVTFRFSTNSASAQNPYGHAAIRYTYKGEQIVMNIVGRVPGLPLVNFLSAEDYLYGDPLRTQEIGSEQGGAYMRSIVGLRIENWPEENIEKLHHYYQQVKQRNMVKEANFSLMWLPLLNALRIFGEKGNCAYWTSKGLVEAKLLKRATMWPKYIFLKLFLQEGRAVEEGNMNIVLYKSLLKNQPKGWLTPLYLWQQGPFFNLGSLANVVVTIDPNANKAIVKPRANVQSFWLQVRNSTKRCRIVLCLTLLSAALASEWMRVPGGLLIHKSCMYEVPNGELVDVDISTCKHMSQSLNLQIYAMDVHYSPPDGYTTQMNASWTVPDLPLARNGQVVYFWPGFKSTEPKMGLPVLQPVLQYGQHGSFWELQSWFVWGNRGVAITAPSIPVSVNDTIQSYMSYDSVKKVWTVFGINTRTGKTTNLQINRSRAGNCDYKWGMLVLETIMNEGACDNYPASSSLTFTGVSLNGKYPEWQTRVEMKDCEQQIAVVAKDSVKLSWNSKKSI
jgi:hypothetical protein